MDGENERHGRPQVYDGQMSDLAKKMQDKRKADRETVKADEQQGKAVPKSKRLTALLEGKRQREQENILKMRTLGIILGILILLLTAALIYEVALGHGTKKTRNERIAEQQRIERRMSPESEKPVKERETNVVDEEET